MHRLILALALSAPLFAQCGPAGQIAVIGGHKVCRPKDGVPVKDASGNLAISATVPDTQTATYGSGTVWTNNRPALRNWQASLANVMYGTASSQAVVLWLGDSWVDGDASWAPLRNDLARTFGDAGIGWVNLDILTAAPGGVTRGTTGTWTDAGTSYATPSATPGINGRSTTSVDVAGTKTVTAMATSFVIHYIKKASGAQFRYKVDTGGYTTVDTANASTVHATEAVAAGTIGSHVLTIEVVNPLSGAAGVTLLGVDIQRSGNGVRVHRAGFTGARTATLTSLDETIWEAGVAAIAPQLVLITLGTNDNTDNVSPTTYSANVAALVSRVRTAVPGVDIVLVPPADNGNVGKTYTVRQYVDAAQNLAAASGYGFVDAHKNFGPYADGNARGMYANSLHLSNAGGRLLGSLVSRYLTDGWSPDTQSSYGFRGTNSAFYGYFSGLSATGTDNTAFGTQALRYATSASYSTAIGSNALAAATTATGNTAVGYNALGATTGASNSAFGTSAMGTNVGGARNVAFGYRAMYVSSSALETTASGANALNALTTGAGNTAVGYQAGSTATAANAVTTGTYNTFLGHNAGPGSATQQNYMTIIGAGATAACDNCVQLGRATDVTIMRPPTSCTGLATGTLWNDGGTLKICP